ncbi:MAG: lamin tail domain-containing protein [Pseudomonadota bacterium]
MRCRRLWVVIPLLCACTSQDPQSLEESHAGMEVSVPGDYPTIQAAVYAASLGDTVLVAPGDYTENVTLISGILLQGAGPDATVLHGQVKVQGDGSELTGFLITAAGASGYSMNSGVIGSGEDFVIRDNVVEGFGSGILAGETSNGEIIANVLRQNQVGISLDEAGPAIRVFNNLVLNNTHAGIKVYANSSPVIVHNTIVGNGFAAGYDTGGAGLAVGPFNHETAMNNIIVSNKGGINAIYESNSKCHHNLVWGNVDNYVGAAQTGTGDLTLDPRFISPGSKDYRLQGDSPAMDAGQTTFVVDDFDGSPRPMGAAPDLGAFEVQPPADTGELVITEVMANPLDEAKGEFVELHNPTEAPLDAAGLFLDDGDAADALVGWQGGPTLVPPGGYAVVLDPDYAQTAEPYDIPVGAILLTVGDATLGSGLSVADPVSLTRDSVTVGTYAHPFNPGNGISAERIQVEGDDTADNWVASPCGASPGQTNCIAAGGGGVGLPTLLISEVMAAPVDAMSGEFVEVYNFGDAPVDLSGLGISDGDTSDAILAVPGKSTTVAPSGYCVIIDPDLLSTMAGAPYFLDDAVPCVVTVAGASIGNGLAKNDPVALLAQDGVTAFTTCSHPQEVTAQSVERIDLDEADLSSNWVPSPCLAGHSAGHPNCAQAGGGNFAQPSLEINEVMANPLDEDLGEFVELRNIGDAAVDVAGLLLSDGDAVDTIGPFAVGGPTVIPPGGYGVILDPEYQGGYALPPSAVLLAPANSTLGNGLANNDPVSLLAGDGVSAISTYSHPFNAGNGISVERKDGTGDVMGNWVASTCLSGSSPGAANCTSEDEPEEPTLTLVISEVMANPLDEGTGEFVEIVNMGSVEVDLAGHVLSDGDSADPLVAFEVGGATVLAAGAYAVVLDKDYPLTTGPYDLPLGVLLLTTGDKTLGNGLATGDPVSLLSPSATVVLATYQYPFNPGNGVSSERLSLEASDSPDNWVASTCESGSSPGSMNCAAGGQAGPGVTVVDVNGASAEELQQVAGIGGATAGQIVAYRDASGPYESLLQLCVLDAVTPSKIVGWQVAEEGEAPFVLGLEGAKEIHIFADPEALLVTLPLPQSPEADAWTGETVRILRAGTLSDNDTSTTQELLFVAWTDPSSYEPVGDAILPIHLFSAPGAPTYAREQTRVVDAMADWIKEDGDPQALPLFYRWSTPVWGWGGVPYGAVFAIEGVLEVYEGAWRVVVRADEDAGLDGLVLIERWLAPDAWASLEVIWTYSYKPVVVENTGGYTHTLPYRLAVAHPCRAWWYDTYGEIVEVPKCQSFGQCGGNIAAAYALFNQTLAAWKQAPPDPGTGTCFTYSSTEYCFTTEEEETGLDILNNATLSQLKEHCYTTSLASTVLANRPFGSIAAYDATPGVGPKSLWNLLVCYVRSGDWPPALPGTVYAVLQQLPDNENQVETVDLAEVTYRVGGLLEICDPGTEHCIMVFSYSALAEALSVGDLVMVTGQVKHYLAGGYWELLLSGPSTGVTILVDQ